MKQSKELTKALEKLNNAITNLPEFGEVMKLVPSNVAITNCELMECKTRRTWGNGNNRITYDGLTLHDGDGNQHNYLIQCCGEELFATSGTLDQIAQDIQTALQNAPKKRYKLQHSLSISDYLRDELDWDITDEIYPHMRQSAVGKFSIKRFESPL